jgi:tripartite-type tricarboxylate transporter receptor subunit TctC
MANIKGGKLKGLKVWHLRSVSLSRRMFQQLKEAGAPMVAKCLVWGYVACWRTQKTLQINLNAAFNKVLKDPEVRKNLQSIGAQVDGGSVADFTKFSQSEIKRYEGIVKMSGAPKE